MKPYTKYLVIGLTIGVAVYTIALLVFPKTEGFQTRAAAIGVVVSYAYFIVQMWSDRSWLLLFLAAALTIQVEAHLAASSTVQVGSVLRSFFLASAAGASLGIFAQLRGKKVTAALVVTVVALGLEVLALRTVNDAILLNFANPLNYFTLVLDGTLFMLAVVVTFVGWLLVENRRRRLGLERQGS